MMRGMAVWVDLRDASSPEMGKNRPAIILSNSAQNAVLDTVVVVPVSSRPPAIPPLRIQLRPFAPRLDGFAIVPGLRQVRKSRILEVIGPVAPEDLTDLEESVQAYLRD